MTNIDLLFRFISNVNKRKKMTLFLNNVFDFNNINDYNYIVRINKNDDSVIFDIYDNVSINRFNRYIFLYNDVSDTYKIIEINNVFCHYININKLDRFDNNLFKFLYLLCNFNEDICIDDKYSFIDKELINILKEIKNKPI